MRIRYHCEVCDMGYPAPEDAEKCESKPASPYEFGTKLVCRGTVVTIVERSSIARKTHDYLYRANVSKSDNSPEAAFNWLEWYHHSEFTPLKKTA